MKNRIQFMLGIAVLATSVSASASFATSLQPGETMGVALESPLPEGVFFADLENYGRRDANPRLNAGVNIPVILWSTPWSYNNTRLEFLAAAPFAHLDGAQGSGISDRVGAISYALGPILAHDFGGGLTGGGSFFVRTPDPSSNVSVITGRTVGQADIRGGLSYKGWEGITLIETSWVTTPFANSNCGACNTSTGMDFSATKTFDKVEFGLVGFAYTDVNTRPAQPLKSREVQLGGLLGYTFDKVTVQAMVTRSVYAKHALGDLSVGQSQKETRGWLRLIYPLYVAPAAPVVAKF